MSPDGHGLRVALLTREFPPAVYGGAGVHVNYLSRELAKLVDVGVHCFGEQRDDERVSASYQPWGALAGGAKHLAALRYLSIDLAIVKGVEGADLVHSHTWYTNLAGHLAKLTYDIPHVLTTHSLEPGRPWKAEQLGGGYRLSLFAERTGILHADAVIAVSHRMRADVLNGYPQADPGRVRVIPNGIDTDEYRPDRRTDAAERIGLRLDRPVVTFVGRITRQKGVTHLLDAAAHLMPEAQLILCAGAPDTPELAREVAAKVEDLRARRTGVLWITQMLPRQEIVQILSHSTVFVCPSIYEPFGLVNVEAMACEVPVVASAVGGIPEVVVDGQTGYLVPFERGDEGFGTPAEPETFARDLAARINLIAADPARAAEMGRNGRARVLAEFAWPTIAERTVELYHELRR